MTSGIHSRRLGRDDIDAARRVFRLMAAAFEETFESLSDSYLENLLGRPDFWMIAAFAGDEPVGGLTAHTLPMTHSESAEIFIYDVAVHAGFRRKGVGRLLLEALRTLAAGANVRELFVAADVEDVHALDFYRALDGHEAPVSIFTFPGK
ncbi:MAG TPA: GNAT family N-acetyltransferase [Gammaproteobacteria bacterium]